VKDTVAVVLAAGKSTRMSSGMNKMVHELAGKPLIKYPTDAAREAGVGRIIVVVGHAAEQVTRTLGEGFTYVRQEKQLGTGHALMQAIPELAGFSGDVLVFNGDSVFLTADSFKTLIKHHRAAKAAATILTAMLPDPGSYGRIVRGADGGVLKIVEKRDASLVELKINEVNSGTYVFGADTVLPLLSDIDSRNAQKEFYLTDIIGLCFGKNLKVETLVSEDPSVVLGVNTRKELAQAIRIFRERITDELMAAGVTILDPESTFVDGTVKVGRDTVIYPFSYLERGTTIGERCQIGPHAHLVGCHVGDDCCVESAVLNGTKIASGTKVPPFTTLCGKG